MVRGLDLFRDHFAGYKDQYVLIGGVASSLVMEDAGLQFRATKDLDVVLVVEMLDAAFVDRFWKFIEAGQYETRQATDEKPRRYRFAKPAGADYPFMLELFSRQPDGVELGENAGLTPLPVDEAVSSLSAILMDDEAYDFVLAGRICGRAPPKARRLTPRIFVSTSTMCFDSPSCSAARLRSRCLRE